MGKNINLRDVELKLRFDNLHITIEQVDYGVFHDSIMRIVIVKIIMRLILYAVEKVLLSLMKKSIRLKKAHYL